MSKPFHLRRRKYPGRWFERFCTRVGCRGWVRGTYTSTQWIIWCPKCGKRYFRRKDAEDR